MAEDLMPSTLEGDEQYEIESTWFAFETAMHMIDSGELCDARVIMALFYYQRQV